MKINIFFQNQLIDKFEKDTNIIKIGRGNDNDLIIKDPKASKNHAVLIKENNNYKIRDLNSTNGTYINDIKINPNIFYPLSDKDTIRIGDTFLKIEQLVKNQKSKVLLPTVIISSILIIFILIFGILQMNKQNDTLITKTTSAEEKETKTGKESAEKNSETDTSSSITTTTTTEKTSTTESAKILDIEGLLPSVVDVYCIYKNGSEGFGSGTVFSKDGYIVTNFHVIKDYKSIFVYISSNNKMNASVIYSNESHDIALLKINTTTLKVPSFGKSSQIKIGEEVIAIGSPFGLSSTVTKGIVSARRDIINQEIQIGDKSFMTISIPKAIQHDAAINPGNSGGPLFNSRGEVVGINELAFSTSGSDSGLNVAIPIDLIFFEISSYIN